MSAQLSTPISPAPVVAALGLAPARRRLSPAAAYGFSAYVIGLCLFASVVPSPLYATYSRDWHLSTVVVTLVFATYAVGVLLALLLVGRLSDEVGRRPVLLAAITGLAVSSVLFIAADGAAWLFAARAVQGLATGAALSAASAALLDLHRRRDPVSVGLANGVASTAGLGLGSLLSALLVAGGTAPRVLPYVMLLVLFALGLTGAALMPEPVVHRTRPRLRPQRPTVPAGIRRHFLLAALAVIASWSLGGLLFALGTGLTEQVLGTHNIVAATFGSFGLAFSASAASLLTHRLVAWRGAAVGALALALGAVVDIAATAAGSGPWFVIGLLITGSGFGVAFLGALRNLGAAIPPAHRAGVMSAFYVVAYASLSVPAVIAGALAPHLGLSHTFEIFAAITGAIALVVALEAYRARPRSHRGAPAPVHGRAS